jgi:PPK2 family polyphosphate:nucleotide phosphotransferase
MFADRYRVDPDTFRLKDADPADTAGWSEADARGELRRSIEELADLQDRFYADGRHALLVIIQALDAAGKDGTVKHVMSGVNPAGCQVVSFKEPSSGELMHDYLWRCVGQLPPRGRIGIFNRSYYEEVAVVRVHPEFLQPQGFDPAEAGENFWRRRFKDMVHFEEHLRHNHTVVLKFFLHVSRKEQKKRLLKRLADPEKNWKFSPTDYEERLLWDDYQAAYDDLLRNTSTDFAPWYVVPADAKWFTHLAVSRVIAKTLRDLKPVYPEPTDEQRAVLSRFKELLEKEE